MCSRFYLKGISPDADEYFRRFFGIDLLLPDDPEVIPKGPEFLPWNDIPAVLNDSGAARLTSMFWNLIPYYEAEFTPTHTWFNTRREKLCQPDQQNLLRSKRCIVLANKFLENKKKFGQPIYQTVPINGKSVRKKETYAFYHEDQPLMALGGIYDIWNPNRQGPRLSCSVITMEPNTFIREIHDRMPFILRHDQVKAWLDPTLDDADFLLEEVILAYPANQLKKMQIWPPSDPQLELL